MNQNWMEKLEERLDAKLAEFLKTNAYQEFLLNKEFKNERSISLTNRKKNLQTQAQNKRDKLLSLGKAVREWKERSNRAKKAGEPQLAEKADQYIKSLMKEGRVVWSELADLGQSFKEVEKEIFELSQRSQLNQPKPTLEKNWEVFQIQEELDELKRNNSFKN